MSALGTYFEGLHLVLIRLILGTGQAHNYPSRYCILALYHDCNRVIIEPCTIGLEDNSTCNLAAHISCMHLKLSFRVFYYFWPLDCISAVFSLLIARVSTLMSIYLCVFYAIWYCATPRTNSWLAFVVAFVYVCCMNANILWYGGVCKYERSGLGTRWGITIVVWYSGNNYVV